MVGRHAAQDAHAVLRQREAVLLLQRQLCSRQGRKLGCYIAPVLRSRLGSRRRYCSSTDSSAQVGQELHRQQKKQQVVPQLSEVASTQARASMQREQQVGRRVAEVAAVAMSVPPAPSHLARRWPLLRPRPRRLLRRCRPQGLLLTPWTPLIAGNWPAQSPVEGRATQETAIGYSFREAG